MEFKGTKGTWIARHNGSYMEVNRKEDFEDGKRLSISVMVFNVKDGECIFDRAYEAKANAHLIAAAPELLEALQRVFEYAKVMINENSPDYKYAEQAINKALNK